MKARHTPALSPSVRLCPVCGGPLTPFSELVSGGSGNYFVCKRCGYKGSIYIEVRE